MRRGDVLAIALGLLSALAPGIAVAETVCGTVDEFNAAMAASGTTSDTVTLTFDIVGVNPAEFGKGSLAQMRDTTCPTGTGATIKVYGTDASPEHPAGTLKLEYGNACCPADCGENWASPNPSEAIFGDGTETCNVTMWLDPQEVGYSLACNHGTFDAVGDNSDANIVDRIELLVHVKADGGTTWELPNATASNDEVCWIATPTDTHSLVVPVAQDVTAGPTAPDTVFADVGDLAVEAAHNEAYLQFVVPPIEGRITRARLFMHTRTESSAEGDGGEVHVVDDHGWSEATLTWNTRPPHEPASLGRIGPATADTPVSLDLGIAIPSPGTYSFAVVSPPTDTNGTHFFSKEGSAADAPYLIVDYEVVDADGDGSPDGPDCNDADPATWPGAAEICNGVDDDCDGQIDEGCDDAEAGSSGDVDDGTGDSAGSGTDEGGLGPGLPAGGRGGDPIGCGCTTPTREDDAPLFLLAVALLAIVQIRIAPRG